MYRGKKTINYQLSTHGGILFDLYWYGRYGMGVWSYMRTNFFNVFLFPAL